MATRRRLSSDPSILDEWAREACQAEKNAVYHALFTVADGSVFLDYDVFQEASKPERFFFLVKEDLLIKINRPDDETFEILYIGSFGGRTATSEKEIDA